MSQEDIEQIIEDVEEKDLVENQETEVTEQPFSKSVLDVILGESKKKEEMEKDMDSNEDEMEESMDSSSDDEEDEMEESMDYDDEEDEMEESMDSSSDDEEDDDEEEMEMELPEVKTKAGYLAASFDVLKSMKKSQLVSSYKALNVSEGEGEMELPKTKAEIINAMYNQFKGMSKDTIVSAYKTLKQSCGGDHSEKESDSFAEDLEVLAKADKGLTEEFKAKASTLFEAAVANKVQGIKEELEAQYAEDLQEEITYIRDTLIEKVDNYLSYVVESWIADNQEFVDNKLRVEITESFMKALQGVFNEHYIEVPDSKIDLVDQLSEEVTEVKNSLSQVESENSQLVEQLEKLQREKVLAEASTDLAITQASRLASLVEEIEFVNPEYFAEKVATVKESFFSSKSSDNVITESSDLVSTTEKQTIVEGTSKLPSDMEKYVSHLSRFK